MKEEKPEQKEDEEKKEEKTPNEVLEQAEEVEPSDGIEEIRRVMFETDSWDLCIKSAVWFGQRVPQKRRNVGRGAAANQKDPVTEFFEDTVTLESAIEDL